MSLRSFDVDRDGVIDIVYSDRKGNTCQVGWLKNPGARGTAWKDHLIGGKGREVMFLDITPNDGSASESRAAASLQIACNTKDGGVLLMRPNDKVSDPWNVTEITHEAPTGSGKGIALADVNSDGQLDLVCTCEHSERKIGVFWLESPEWTFRDISGAESGVKFDRIEMLDLDGDGDHDLLTCEERHNLGVFWYENTVGDTSRE